MLVYERKKKSDIRQITNEAVELVNYRSIPKFVPEWLQSQVSKDNIEFVIDRQVFDDNFFVMVKQILEHISQTIVASQHNYKFDYYQWFDKLKELSLRIG